MTTTPLENSALWRRVAAASRVVGWSLDYLVPYERRPDIAPRQSISAKRDTAILVASLAVFDAECKTPRQMQLANAFCRFQELATQIPPP